MAYQSNSAENAWLAFIVMLHMGSALGLLICFWRDWLAIIKAFFATLGKRRAETTGERMARLIIAASIPTGILGLAFEHATRVATGEPAVAAIFLAVNGVVLFVAQRLMRRAEVTVIARREGIKADGDRMLETLEHKEAAGLGLARPAGLTAGISRDGMVMAAGVVAPARCRGRAVL